MQHRSLSMKGLLTMGLIAGIVSALCGCRNAEPATLNKKPEGRILVACYSESKNKNTLTAAKWIHQNVGGDLLEIEMVTPYSESYKDVLKESKKHLDDGVKPDIKPTGKNIADYDVIFIGSPVWYGTFAPPVATFLSQGDFSGKTVIPFCTHGGGGAGKLYDDIAKAVPQAKVLPGLTLKGSNIIERTIGRGTASKASPDEVIRWLNDITPEYSK